MKWQTSVLNVDGNILQGKFQFLSLFRSFFFSFSLSAFFPLFFHLCANVSKKGKDLVEYEEKKKRKKDVETHR